METKHLCSAANTWSLGFCSPSPKKRSGDRAHQVCKAPQQVRTGTKNMMSRGAMGIATQEDWLQPTRPPCRWERHGNLRNHTRAVPILCGMSERWNFLRSASLTNGINGFSFYIEEIWEPQWSWLPPMMVFNTCDFWRRFCIPLRTNFYFISLSGQPNNLEYQL